ncbi:hypothetical protein AURDEDRAFT_171020 [Auricularia subglabra TFB-10046 SS5]|nr:hypothetical protein AURDEDRAFT_171020 [Auricularia subglabra TFB-10046 SS5]
MARRRQSNDLVDYPSSLSQEGSGSEDDSGTRTQVSNVPFTPATNITGPELKSPAIIQRWTSASAFNGSNPDPVTKHHQNAKTEMKTQLKKANEKHRTPSSTSSKDKNKGSDKAKQSKAKEKSKSAKAKAKATKVNRNPAASAGTSSRKSSTGKKAKKDDEDGDSDEEDPGVDVTVDLLLLHPMGAEALQDTTIPTADEAARMVADFWGKAATSGKPPLTFNTEQVTDMDSWVEENLTIAGVLAAKSDPRTSLEQANNARYILFTKFRGKLRRMNTTLKMDGKAMYRATEPDRKNRSKKTPVEIYISTAYPMPKKLWRSKPKTSSYSFSGDEGSSSSDDDANEPAISGNDDDDFILDASIAPKGPGKRLASSPPPEARPQRKKPKILKSYLEIDEDEDDSSSDDNDNDNDNTENTKSVVVAADDSEVEYLSTTFRTGAPSRPIAGMSSRPVRPSASKKALHAGAINASSCITVQAAPPVDSGPAELPTETGFRSPAKKNENWFQNVFKL